jgi:hypothetical protein
VNLVGVDVDTVDRGFDELDADVQLPFAGTHDVFAVRKAERHEEQTRLVDVPVVLVDHRYGRLFVRVQPPQTVGGQGAAGSAAEDHDPRSHRTNVPDPTRAY